MRHAKKTRAGIIKKLRNTIYATRPECVVICRKCGTAQSSEQDFCRLCGSMFIFLDETNRYTA